MIPRRALIIAHEPDGLAQQVAVRLRERGLEIVEHIITADLIDPAMVNPWPDLAEFDIIVAMGSIRSLTDKATIDSWVHDELAMLAAAHDRGQPILGICFGAQLMAEALGGRVEKSPVTEIGWYDLAALPGIDNPAGPGPWFEWHHDRLIPPPGAQVLAYSESAIQLFRLGRTVGTQFHPEVDTDHITEWVRGCPPGYLEEHGVDPDNVLAEIAEHEDRNTKQCHAFIDWWLDEVAFGSAAVAS